MQTTSVAFKTLGCKLNFSETATLERQLSAKSYKILPFESEADIYVINTCTVTEQAEKKCRYYVNHIRKNFPKSKIFLMGCYTALRAEQISKELKVDAILGSNTKFLLVEKIEEIINSSEPYIFERDKEKEKTFFGAYSLNEERTRSFLKVQDGCDYYCTYCTIPMARGHFRSAETENVIASAKDIINHGIKEIVLSGVNIGEYNSSMGEKLIDLLRSLSELRGLRRLRISSIEPNLLTDEIIKYSLERENIMPHFHIPLQSGCNRILEKMHRRYDTDLFERKVELIKHYNPYACIAADVIVGFPGETDSDFEETLNFIQRIPLTYLHVFPYSQRPGTLAASMPGQLGKACKEDRVKILISLSEKKKSAFYKLNIGRRENVLIESREKNGFYGGFTENYIRVKFKCSEDEINTIKSIKINEENF